MKGIRVEPGKADLVMRHGSKLAVGVALVVAMLGPTAHATAPGQNGRIAFVRYFNEERSRGAIFTIRPNGTGLVQLTNRERDLLDTEPDWSPDGRWILFYREAPGAPLRLFKVRPNGSDVTRVSHGPCVPGNCASDLEGVWSPKGHRIVFTRVDGEPRWDEGLYVMRSDGSHARLVTSRGAEMGGYAGSTGAGWSPDGKRLVFQRQNRNGALAIFTVRLDGTGDRRLTPWRLNAGDHPDWSPDGRWIVFRSHVDQDRQGNVYLVHPNGTDLHRITDTHTHGATNYLSYSFSPDGTMITVAYTGVGDPGNPDVWVMNLDGSDFRNVTSSVIWDSRPDWGPRST